MAVLDKAPMITSSKAKMKPKDFIHQARAIAGDGSIHSVKQGVKALEALLPVDDVTATITSTPDNLIVNYRRYVDDESPWESATTNTTKKVAPALYRFNCVNKVTGEKQEQTQSCASDCKVKFVF